MTDDKNFEIALAKAERELPPVAVSEALSELQELCVDYRNHRADLTTLSDEDSDFENAILEKAIELFFGPDAWVVLNRWGEERDKLHEDIYKDVQRAL